MLDFLHGGTLSYVLGRERRIPESHVVFFAACIILAFQVERGGGEKEGEKGREVERGRGRDECE